MKPEIALGVMAVAVVAAALLAGKAQQIAAPQPSLSRDPVQIIGPQCPGWVYLLATGKDDPRCGGADAAP